MAQIKVGKIISTFGVKGEVKIFPYSDNIEEIKSVYIKDKQYDIEKMRKQKNIVVAKIKGIDTIEAAELLRNSELAIDEEAAPKLEENTYYIDDLIGIDVYTDEGKHLGKLNQVYETKANDVYEVDGIMIPAIKDVVKDVDLEGRRMTIHLIDGLM